MAKSTLGNGQLGQTVTKLSGLGTPSSSSVAPSTAGTYSTADLVRQALQAASGQAISPAIPNASSYTAPTTQYQGGTNSAYQTQPLTDGNNTNYNYPVYPSSTDTSAVENDPTQDLVNALISSVIGSADTSAGLMSAASAAGSPYAAQIGSVRHANKAAKKTTAKSDKAIKKMYKALAADDAAAATAAQDQGTTDAAAQQQIANTAAATVNNSINDQLDKNAASANALGVDASGFNTPLQESTAQSVAKIAQEGQTAAQYATGTANNQRNLLNNYASSDRLEGTNRRADLQNQLVSYLQGNRDKIAELQGQKASAILSAQQSAAATANDAQDSYIKNLLNTISTVQGIKNDNASNSNDQLTALSRYIDAQNSSSSSNSLSKALETLNPKAAAASTLESYLNSDEQAALNNALNSSAYAQNQIKLSDGTTVPITGNLQGANALLSNSGYTGDNSILSLILQSLTNNTRLTQ